MPLDQQGCCPRMVVNQAEVFSDIMLIIRLTPLNMPFCTCAKILSVFGQGLRLLAFTML